MQASKYDTLPTQLIFGSFSLYTFFVSVSFPLQRLGLVFQIWRYINAYYYSYQSIHFLFFTFSNDVSLTWYVRLASAGILKSAFPASPNPYFGWSLNSASSPLFISWRPLSSPSGILWSHPEQKINRNCNNNNNQSL